MPTMSCIGVSFAKICHALVRIMVLSCTLNWFALDTDAISQLPKELLSLLNEHEAETKLVIRLLSLDPRLRPSAIQILESPFLKVRRACETVCTSA